MKKSEERKFLIRTAWSMRKRYLLNKDDLCEYCIGRYDLMLYILAQLRYKDYLKSDAFALKNSHSESNKD